MRKIQFNKHYRFAIYSSLYITLCLTVLSGGFMYYFNISLWILLLGSVFCYIICFGIIQYYVEQLVYKKVHDIYQNVFTDLPHLYKKNLSANIDSLSAEVERFRENKRLQIEDLKIQDDFRKEFIGNLAHELKTPLFTAQSYLLTLQDGAIDNMQVRDKYLDRASNSLGRLVDLVEDLDKIAKLETKEESLNIERVDIVSLTQQVFEMLEVMAKKKISLTFDTLYPEVIEVLADSKKIHNVLVNLISNSIKYGKLNGTTEVAFEVLDNKILIRINDNGDGIAQNHLSRLFERFYRVDKSGSRKQGGSGLGLAIVKHIIEAHQQIIKVESQEGLGTEFSFSLEAASK